MQDIAKITTKAKAEADEFLELVKTSLGNDVELAQEICREAKEKRNELEAQRKHLKEPTLEAGRRIDEMFRPPIDVLNQVIGIGKGVIQKAIEQQRAEQAAALRAAETKEALVKAAKPPEKLGSTRRIRHVRAADWSQIPATHLILNERSVLAAIDAGDEVPGVEVYFDEIVVNR